MLNQNYPEKPVITALLSALLKARASLTGRVHKAGHNEHQDYHYAGHEQVVMTARSALLANGLVLEQQSVEQLPGERVQKTRYGEVVIWSWRAVAVLWHAETGQCRHYTFEATTPASDKAAYAASTALDRTAHLRVLQLTGSDHPEDPGADDVEHDSYESRSAGVSTPDHGARLPELGRLSAELDAIRDSDLMVRWAARVLMLKTKESKDELWKQFGLKCLEMKIDPKEVSARARAMAKNGCV